MSDVSRALANLGRAPVGSMRALAEAQPVTPKETAPEPGADQWAKVRIAANALHPGPLGFVLWLDAQCQRAGMPAASPFWLYTLTEFYGSGKRWLFCLVGRGGGKSKILELVAAADNFFGERTIPSGETWAWIFISVNSLDARRRIDGIASRMRAGGVPAVSPVYSPTPRLALSDSRGNSIEWISTAGTIGNASGATANGVTLDEAAKIGEHTKTGELRANPLSELLISIAETFRAAPNTRAICSSSAWDREGTHWQAIEEGDNEARFIARLGPFVADAQAGLEAVAKWERARGNGEAAKRILTHAATLSERSVHVPTWVANPAVGSPDRKPWDPRRAAVATREEVQIVPERALEGIPRDLYWFRENASVPLDKAGAAGMGSVSAVPGRYASTDPRRDAPRGRLRP